MATDTPAQFDGTLKVATYPNRYSTVIPPEGPFYRTGLEISINTVVNGVTQKQILIEGLDYYLGYYYKEASEAFNDAIFGGIMLLNATECNYSLYSAGREYRIPQTEIGKWLVREDMKDPRNEDWSALMSYAPTIPAIDPPADMDEAILRDEIVAALNDIRNGLVERASEMDEAYADVTDLIYTTGKKIFDDGLYQHHLLKSQGHSYTADDIGALGVSGKAVDATYAFGMALNTLVTMMSTSGIQAQHLAQLMRNDTALNNVFGRLRVLNNNVLTYNTANNDHVITFKGPNILVSTKKPLTFTADSGNGNAGLAVEMAAGLNTLMVHSGNEALAPVFNGVYLITPDMVEMYLHAVTLKAANGYMASTDTVKVYGSGKSYSPFRLEANLPDAEVGLKGLVKVTNNRATVTPGYAISQSGITAMRDLLANYVDDTYTVNGKSFDANQAIVLTTTDVGVEKMNNTAPVDKPVTKALTVALAGKALSTHTHTLADVTDVPYASSTAAGLVLLWNLLDESTDRVVTSKQGYTLQLTLADLESKAAGLIPTWAVLGSSYGNLSFLPIPTSGNYTGFAQLLTNDASVVVKEENNKVYVLRNASDGYPGSEKVLYWSADIVSNQITNASPTTARYTPAGLAAIAPGVTLSKIIAPGEDGAVFVGSDNNWYLVLFDGTINMAKHTRVARITVPAVSSSVTQKATNPNESRVVVTSDKVLLLQAVLNNDDFYTVAWTAPLSDFGSKTDITLAILKLTGKYVDGDIGRFVTQGQKSTDPATNNLWYSNAEALAKWSSPAVVSYTRRTVMAAYKDGKVRVRLHPRGRPTGTTASILGPAWTVSYVIDLATGNVTLDDDYFPLFLGVDGVEFPKGTYGVTSLGVAYGASYMTAFLNNGIVYWCGGSETEDNLYRGSTAQTDNFAALRWDNLINQQYNVVPVLGPYGTVYGFRERGMVHLGGTSKQALFRQRSTAICMRSAYNPDGTYGVPNYGGWGPSNDRSAVSQTDYENVCRLGYVWDGSKCYLNGTSFNAAGSQAYKNNAGSTTLTTDRITVSAQQWTDYENFINTNLPDWSNAATEMRNYWLSFFDIGGLNVCIAAIEYTQKNSDGVYVNYTYIFKIPFTFNSNALVLNWATAVTVLNKASYTINTTGLQLADSNINQMRLIKCADGWVIRTRILSRWLTTGTASNVAYTLRCDTNWANWKAARSAFYVGSGELDLIHMPETNEIVQGGFVYSGVYLGGVAYPGNTINFDTQAGRNVVLFGPQVETGAIQYITEAQRFFIGSAEYTLPQYSINFATAFTNWQNSTFYFYAETYTDGGVLKARYTVTQTLSPDTDTRLYIGYVKTNDTTISETNINAVKRLGGIRQLKEHMGTVYRHDINPSREFRESPLALLKPVAIGTAGDTFAGQSALSDNVGVRLTRPTINRYVPASQPWYSGASLAELFWRTPRAVAVTSAENADAAALGLIWIDINQRSMPGLGAYGTKFKVNTTTGTLRIQFSVDDYCNIYIDGVRVASGATSGSSVLKTLDFPVSNGQHTVAIETVQAETVGGTICHIAFIAYDWNGTAGRELYRSSSASKVGWTTSQGNTAGNMDVLETISHVYTPESGKTAVISVVAPEIPYAPRWQQRDPSTGNLEVVIASKFFGPDGAMVTLTEITVNLMLIPTSDLSS